MAKPSTPSGSDWVAAPTGAALQVNGRLYGADADAIRAVAQDGDGVMDALRRFVTMALAAHDQAADARARETRLHDHLATQAAAIQHLSKSYNALLAMVGDLSRHVSAMSAAQAQTAADSKVVAAECAVIRNAVVQSVERMAAPVAHLNELVEFQNALLDTLAAGASPAGLLDRRALAKPANPSPSPLPVFPAGEAGASPAARSAAAPSAAGTTGNPRASGASSAH